jgi:hypothetical protein
MVRVLAPLLALLCIALVLAGAYLVTCEARRALRSRSTRRAERARQEAIEAARWETYAEPDAGGQAAIGVRKVARWDGGRFDVADELVESVPEFAYDRRTEVMAVAMNLRDFYNGFLPRREDDEG